MVYIDDEFKCHLTNDGTMTAVEDDYFDGKCKGFIEGLRFVPEGKHWIRPSDGKVFEGKMITLLKPRTELDAAQAQYEADLAEAAAAYQEGVDSV